MRIHLYISFGPDLMQAIRLQKCYIIFKSEIRIYKHNICENKFSIIYTKVPTLCNIYTF